MFPRLLTALVLMLSAGPPILAWQPPEGAAVTDDSGFDTPGLLDQVHALEDADLPALQARADGGEARAQVLLGLVYEIGLAGVTPEPRQALSWFMKAAVQNVPWAQSWAADFYFAGSPGVDRDVARALDLYTSAAARGDGRAAFAAGQIYFHGDGVPVDHGQAARWFRRAVSAEPDAAGFMAELAEAPCTTAFCVELRRAVGAMLTGWADRLAAEWHDDAREWSSDLMVPGSARCGFTSSDRTATGEVRTFFCDSEIIADEAQGAARATDLAGEVLNALPAGFERTDRPGGRPGPSALLSREGFPAVRVSYNLTPGLAQHRVTLLIGR